MFFVIIFLISRKIPGYALRITPQAIFFARVSANDRLSPAIRDADSGPGLRECQGTHLPGSSYA